jgi:hypothetical protein
MRWRILIASWASVTAVCCVPAPSASAVECGQAGQDGTPTVGKLTLDTEQTPLEPLDFGDSTDDGGFMFVFKVAGCSISSKDDLTSHARLTGDAQASLGDVEVDPKGTIVVVSVPVYPKKFPAKVVKPLLTIGGDAIEAVSMRLTMQRKEPLPIPLLLALFAGAIGGGWALWVAYDAAQAKKKSNQFITFSGVHATTAVVAGIIAGYAVFKATYLDPTTWELSPPHVLTLMVGVAAAACGGATTGATSAVALGTRKRRRKARKGVADASAATASG